MIAKINDDLVEGALCGNCRGEMRGMKLSTNRGHQVVYVCEQDSCKNVGRVTVKFLPPPVTIPKAVE